MNLVLNRLDNIKVESKSFELFPASRMDEIKLCGAVVGVNAEYIVNYSISFICILPDKNI